MTAGSGALSGVARAVRRRVRPTFIERRIASLGLGPGDIAIDCGANVGEVTVELARRGALVHAFEPNPDAFAVLEERFANVDHVVAHPQAVLERAGRIRLYLHVDAAQDPVGASRGSSTLAFKGNVDPERFVDVDAVDIVEFIRSLGRPVKVLKLDVEGAECPIIHRMLDTRAIDNVETTLVELHDRHIPELRSDYARLRERLEREGLEGRVLTDWL